MQSASFQGASCHCQVDHFVQVRPRSENILQFINNRVTNGIKLHKLLELIARARDAEEGGKGTAAEGGEVEGETEGGDEER